MFVIGNRLNLASMAVTGSLKDIECIIVDEMPIFVHISDGPITQLAIVNDAARFFRTISTTGTVSCLIIFQIAVEISIYLNENARHVNLVVLMHSISHSPTERTLSESRTIDLKKRVPSIARKKHSEKRDHSIDTIFGKSQIKITYVHLHLVDYLGRLSAVPDTFEDHRTLRKYRSLGLVRCLNSNPNDSSVDRTANNCLVSAVNIGSCRWRNWIYSPHGTFARTRSPLEHCKQNEPLPCVIGNLRCSLPNILQKKIENIFSKKSQRFERKHWGITVVE